MRSGREDSSIDILETLLVIASIVWSIDSIVRLIETMEALPSNAFWGELLAIVLAEAPGLMVEGVTALFRLDLGVSRYVDC